MRQIYEIICGSYSADIPKASALIEIFKLYILHLANVALDLAFNHEISLGDLSLVIAGSAFIYSLYRDRKFKEKESADKIRNAAGIIAAKIERWRELNLRFFQEIQPLITDSDILLVQTQDAIKTRDFLWSGLDKAKSISLQRIVDEQIEIAYSDLYGYDPRIQTIFSVTVEELKLIDEFLFNKLLVLTQQNVLDFENQERPPTSSKLGNILRETCKIIYVEYKQEMDKIIAPFIKEMIKLIKSTDNEIVNRKIDIIIPDLASNQKYILSWLNSSTHIDTSLLGRCSRDLFVNPQLWDKFLDIYKKTDYASDDPRRSQLIGISEDKIENLFQAGDKKPPERTG